MSLNRSRGLRRAVALLCGVSATAATPLVFAQASPPASGAMDEVIVTGSRIARPNLESTVPVTTIQGDEIFSTGNTSIGDLLNDLPALRSTFSQSNSSRFLGTTGLNLLDLRGLGTQRTLVLVNGRRHVGSDILGNAVSPDTNTFPTDLIERVDVVTGGNSAVYGSDAIAGVVNFVLKKDFTGLQFRGQGGLSDESDAGNYYASVLGGTNFMDDRGNIAFNLEYAKQDEWFATDRENLAKNSNFVVVDSDPAGTTNGSDGIPDRLFYDDVRFASVANGGSFLLATNAMAPTAPCGVDRNNTRWACSYVFNPDGTLVPQTGERIGLAPTGNFNGGNGMNNREENLLAIYPKLDRYSFNVFGNLALSDHFAPYIEAKYVRTESLRFGSPAFFQGTTMGAPAATTGSAIREQVRFDNPFMSTQARAALQAAQIASGNAAFTDASRIPLRRNLIELGPRQEDATRETTRIVLGASGEIGAGFSYDVAVNWGKFKEDTIVLGNLDKQRFLLAMDAVTNPAGQIVCRSQIDPAARIPYSNAIQLGVDKLAEDVSLCVPLNPFGQGSINAAMQDYLLQDTTSVAKIEQFVASAGITGDTESWFSLPAGPIGVAFGLEYRTEENYFSADDLVSSGLTFYNALPLLDPPKFKVSEVYTEFHVPLLKEIVAAHELSLSLAGRYAEYDVGNTGGVFAYNAGLDWAPIESLRFRGGLARAVRAPSLVDLYSAQSQNFAQINDPCAARFIGGGSPTRAANCAAHGIPATFDYTYPSTPSFVSGGNPNLNEETSDSLTVGFVLQPTGLPGFVFSADYFDIDIEDVITAPTAQQIMNACYDAPDVNNQFCGLFQRLDAAGTPGASPPNGYALMNGTLQQTLLNYASSTSRGVDIEVGYTGNIGETAKLATRLIYTRMLQRDEFLDPVNPDLPNQELLELGDPENAFNLNVDLSLSKFTLGYQLRYLGRMVTNLAEDVFSVGPNPPQNADWADYKYYPEVMYHDIRAQYDISDEWSAYLGVDNLTDRIPPLGLTGTGEGSGIYDVRARYYYAGFKVEF